MKAFLPVTLLVILSVGAAQQPSRASLSHTYVLKAWLTSGDSKTLFWSIDEEPSEDSSARLEQSPGVLYQSLAAPALRERVKLLPAGTKLKFRGSVRGGVLSSAEEDKDWQQFVAFCNTSHIVVDFFIITD